MDAENKTPAFVAYYGLLQLHAHTFEGMARDFEDQAGIPVSWYELLACLQGAGEEGKRMNELADTLLISRGGATKLVARLEAAGYVDRITPKHDRRATFAKITAQGDTAATAGHPIQLRLVEQYFGRFVDQDDLDQLTQISSKVLKGLDIQCTWLDAISPPLDAAALGSAASAA